MRRTTAKLTPAHRQVLTTLVAAQPDATLAELGTGLRQQTRLSVGKSTIWHALAELRMTLKKRPV